MNRSRVTADLASHGNIFVDIANDRVGIGSTIPTHKVDLDGSFKLHDGSGYNNHITYTQNPPTITFPTGPLANLSKTPTLVFGDRTSGGDLKIYQDYYSLHIRHLGPSGFHIGSQASHLQISGSNGSNAVQAAIRIDAGATEGVKLYSGGTQRFETVGYGVTVLGTTETQELNVTGISTFNDDVTFTGTYYNGWLWDKSADLIRLKDNTRLYMGSSAHRFNMRHDGTYNWIQNQISNPLLIDGGSGGVAVISGANYAGGKCAQFIHNGAVELYWDNSKKLETKPYGIDVTGTTSTDGLTVSGVTTTTDHINIDADSKKLTIGDAQDLELYHNGSNSFIVNKTGYLQINATETEVGLYVNPNAAVRLAYNGDMKFETTASGARVFNGASGGGILEVYSGDAGSAAGPEIKLYRNSSSPADADYLGQIKFAGESDTGVERNYAKITGKILDASNGTEDGIIEFAHIKAGSQVITGRFRSDSLQLLNGTNFSVAGTSSFSDHIDLPDDKKIKLGSSEDFQIYHDPNTNVIYGTAPISIQTNDTTSGISFVSTGGHETIAKFVKDGDCTLFRDNSPRIKTTAGGITVTNNLGHNTGVGEAILINTNPTNTNDGSKISFARTSTVYAEICTQKMDVNNNTDMYFKTGTSPTERLRLTSTGQVTPSGHVVPGADSTYDLGLTGTRWRNFYADTLYGDGSNLTGVDTDLVSDSSPQLGADLDVNGNTIKSGHQIYEIVLNQRHNFKSAGNTIMNINGNGVDFQHGNNTHADNVKSQFGASNDLQIYHDGSHSRIVDSGTGNLILQTSKLNINNAANNEALIHASENGAVELYHDNTLRYVSYSGGVKISTSASQGRLVLADTSGNFAYQLTGTDPAASGESGGRLVVQDANGGMVVDSRTAGGNMFLYNNIILNGNATADNLKLIMGAGQDFQLYHDGTNSRIHNTATGAIVIKNEALDGDFMIQANDGGTNQNLLHFDTSETGLASFHGEINMRGTNRIRFYHNTGNGTFQSFIGQRFINNNFNLVIDNQQNNIFYQSDRHVFRDKSGEGGEVFAEFIKDAGLELYFNGNKKLETTNIGCKITGGHGDGLQIENGGTNLSSQIKLKNSTVNKEYTLGVAGNTGNNGQNSSFVFRDETANTTRLEITSSGNLIPGQGSTYDLGATGRAWNNLYVNDMHFSNEGSSNSVDGTWGDWTLQEGENDVFMINNRTGKKFAITMREVS